MKRRIQIFAVATLAWAGLASVHFASVRRLDSELEALRSQIEGRSQTQAGTVEHQGSTPELSAASAGGEKVLSGRLTELEQEVERLSRAADSLMDGGQLALATNRLEGFYRRFSDPASSDAERLRALAVLRHNGALSDEVVSQAIAWMESASDPRTRREILKQLDGATNATFKTTLLGVAERERGGNIRQEAVADLRPRPD